MEEPHNVGPYAVHRNSLIDLLSRHMGLQWLAGAFACGFMGLHDQTVGSSCIAQSNSCGHFRLEKLNRGDFYSSIRRSTFNLRRDPIVKIISDLEKAWWSIDLMRSGMFKYDLTGKNREHGLDMILRGFGSLVNYQDSRKIFIYK